LSKLWLMYTGLTDNTFLEAELDLHLEHTLEDGGINIACIRYYSHSIDGYPLQVAAYVSRPSSPGPHPGLLHLHGGAQRADHVIARDWAKRGFTCLCVDWSQPASVQNAPHATQWPEGFPTVQDQHLEPEQAAVTHIVRAVRRGISVLEQDPDVTDKIGICGISWGGFMTWLVNALDSRLSCAIPVYGAGFAPKAENHAAWHDALHPDHYAEHQQSPVLHVNGTHDFFGHLDQSERMLSRCSSDHRRIYVPNEDHGLNDPARHSALAWLRQHLQASASAEPEPRLELKDGQLHVEAPGARSLTLHSLRGSQREGVWKSRPMSEQPINAPAEADWAYVTANYGQGFSFSSSLLPLPPASPLSEPESPELFHRWNYGNLVLHSDPSIKVLQDEQGWHCNRPDPILDLFLRLPQDQPDWESLCLEWSAAAGSSIKLDLYTSAHLFPTSQLSHPRIQFEAEGRHRFRFLKENFSGEGRGLPRVLHLTLKSHPPKSARMILHSVGWDE